MKQNLRVIIDRHGPPDIMKLVEEMLPEPGPGQVRLRIRAAGVGYSDVMAQRGGYPLAPRLPFTPGYDLAGVVDKVGVGVEGMAEGQTVAALHPDFGCYARYLCVPASILVPYPAHLEAAEVASLVLNYLTAHCILHKKAKVRRGDSALVHSAAGGVGTALIQLGVLAGLTLYGTASRAKTDLVRQLGAIPIDYQTEDFVAVLRDAVPGGVDAAFDPMGGANLRRSYRAVKPGGRVVCYGFAGNHFGGLLPMASGVLQMTALNLLPDGKRVSLCATPGECRKDVRWYRDTLALLIDLLAKGAIKPVVGALFPLTEVSKAHALLESGKAVGKVVLACDV